MFRRSMIVAVAAGLLFTMAQPASAQVYKIFNGVSDADLRTLYNDQQITTNDIDKQVEAILQLFSSLAGAGFVNTASLHNLGGVDVGLRGVFAVIPDEFKDIIPDKAIGNRTVRIKDPLEGEDTVPLPFLNASIGLPANFEAHGRLFYFPLGDDPTDGAVAFLGGALKYGLLRGNLALPDVTVLVGYQTFIVPDEYDFGTVKTFSFKGFASKGFGFVTLYAGGGLDRTSLKLKRDRIPLPLPPDFKLDYDGTHGHGTVGLTIKPIPFLRVNADYNFGKFPNFTIGANLSVR